MITKYKYIEGYVIEEIYRNIENNNILDEYKDYIIFKQLDLKNNYDVNGGLLCFVLGNSKIINNEKIENVKCFDLYKYLLNSEYKDKLKTEKKFINSFIILPNELIRLSQKY